MAINYADLLPSLRPMIQDCPDIVLRDMIRRVVIHFAKYTETHQVELDPVSATAGIYEYDLEAPAGTEVHRILRVTYNGTPLKHTTPELRDQRMTGWRNSSGTPKAFILTDPLLFEVYPIPGANATSAIRPRVALRPTYSSNAADESIMNEHRETIINGTAAKLLMIPNRDWTDLKSSQYYKQEYLIESERARTKARFEDNPIGDTVAYGGIEGSYSTDDSDYGNPRYSF